jgi:uncharacterized protein (TIGR03435 family)
MTRHRVTSSLLPVFLVLGLIDLAGQQRNPTFEVASVKRNTSGATAFGQNTQPGGRYAARNTSLMNLILYAYGIWDFQLVGGPDWVKNDRFDIVAKAEIEVPRDQIKLMLQALLEDRFRLSVRKEQREMPIYALVADRSDGRLGRGLLKLSEQLDCKTAFAQPIDGLPRPTRGAVDSSGCGPMSTIADMAKAYVGRVVVDQTQLTGEWHFRLYHAPAVLSPSAPVNSDVPPLPTALREQLGLKLQATRGPVDVFVIQSVQRPTDD